MDLWVLPTIRIDIYKFIRFFFSTNQQTIFGKSIPSTKIKRNNIFWIFYNKYTFSIRNKNIWNKIWNIKKKISFNSNYWDLSKSFKRNPHRANIWSFDTSSIVETNFQSLNLENIRKQSLSSLRSTKFKKKHFFDFLSHIFSRYKRSHVIISDNR